MARGDNAAASAVGEVFDVDSFVAVDVFSCVDDDGIANDEEDEVAAAEMLMLVGTEDARIVAVGETGTG